MVLTSYCSSLFALDAAASVAASIELGFMKEADTLGMLIIASSLDGLCLDRIGLVHCCIQRTLVNSQRNNKHNVLIFP